MTGTSTLRLNGGELTPSRSVLRLGSLKWRQATVGYLFLVPLIAGLLIFRFYAFGYNIWLSFTTAGAFGQPRFVGLDNYRRLFSDSQLVIALYNTVKFAAIAVPGVVIVSLLCALLMQYRFRGASIFRAIVFLPAVCLPTAIILVFGWLFQTQYGLINAAFHALGAEPMSWFGSETGVTAVVSIIVVYLSFSVPAIILYAGMQDLPSDVYEAAMLDGAGPVRRFFSITLPLLTPSLFFVILTSTIGILKLFDAVYLLLPPVDHSVSTNYGLTLVYYYYYLAFVDSGQRGYAAAVSLFLLLLILGVSIVLLRLQRRFVHYGEDG
ncbi:MULTISPECIES: carbohydrate ABC transporter permease [unclassified Neorhizobium]|uniref:carbohydrate ABC transporter permease n=1 Tax=unclassified Neorhizobium TaxID=2629175 RepID=UPI001FF61870|nr:MULTISPECIES: sugar ABC transporter permease [unclassified Neorhizobium]MCJ9672219.1 sugar ABC transporter permease [Neorhizobium sp. SHOUNA12B]MCJ9748048.1 sugar ABC transporter permease [Neorhizobium sp. SHOUNA12A]